MITLTLPYPPKELSPNARCHWRVKSAKVRSYRDLCHILARQQTRVKLPAPVTARVTFVVTVNRKRDEDNLGASIKALWDGLVDAGILAADSTEYLHIERPAIEKGPVACVRVELEGKQ